MNEKDSRARFYVPDLTEGAEVALPQTEAHHAAHVLRLAPGVHPENHIRVETAYVLGFAGPELWHVGGLLVLRNCVRPVLGRTASSNGGFRHALAARRRALRCWSGEARFFGSGSPA